MDPDDFQTRRRSKYQPINLAGEADEVELADISSTWTQMPGPLNKTHQLDYDGYGINTLNNSSSRNPLLNGQDAPSLRQRAWSGKSSFWSKSILTDWWFWELANWLIGTLCMISIFIILHRYDGQLLPKWRFGITINTLISTFAAIARACLLVPIAQGLSQLKWSWFTRGKRSLIDFQDFDMASRGWYGSMKMLLTRRYWCLPGLPILGAILTMVALATEPITQSSVSYPLKLVADNSDHSGATSPRSTLYSALDQNTEQGASYTPQDVDTSTQAAIFSGVLYGNTSFPMIAPTCSSGNCTWAPYTTLGVCASIADVTSNLTGNCISTTSGEVGDCNFNLGGGAIAISQLTSAAYYVFTTNEEVDGFAPPNYNVSEQNIRSVAFEGAQYPIVDFFLLFSPTNSNSNGPRYIAAEIILQFCVQTLSTTVRRGVATTTVTDWFTDFALDGPTSQQSQGGGNITATPSQEEAFHVFGGAFFVLNQNLRTMFSTNWTIGDDGGNSGYPSTGMQAIYTSIISFPYNIEGLGLMAGNLATSLSNNIRTRNTTAPSMGIAEVEVTYVKVDWNWVTLISFMAISSIGFMLLVIIDNSRVDNLFWRSSSLASLKALEPSTSIAMRSGLSTNAEMEEIAKITTVRLRKGAQGWMVYSQ